MQEKFREVSEKVQRRFREGKIQEKFRGSGKLQETFLNLLNLLTEQLTRTSQCLFTNKLLTFIGP